MPSQFTDETTVSAVMSFGNSGSLDFGGTTPSSSSCQCTLDGGLVNSGGNMGPGTAGPGGNSRTVGSVTLGAGASQTISTGKSVFAIVNNDNEPSSVAGIGGIAISSHSAGSFTLFNYNSSSVTSNYSYM